MYPIKILIEFLSDAFTFNEVIEILQDIYPQL